MLKKAKVIYYLSDNSTFSQGALVRHLKSSDMKFISKDEEGLKHFVSFLPPGTIFAQSYGVEEKNNIVCLPLISSHISLPLKQGEFVWYISDNDSKKNRANSEEIFKNHPALSINDYWLSRIHGSLVSEDVNYSFKERDSLILDKKVTKESLEEKNKKSAILPSFDIKSIFISNENDSELKSTKSLYEEGLGNYFGDKAVPRMFSRSDDLTIQGCYNTLINFTASDSSISQNETKEGLIDIVAGRLSLQDFTVKDDVEVKFKKLIKNSISLENKNKEEEITLSLEKFVKIDNTSGGEELFKKPSLYLNEDITFNMSESEVDYESDASRLLISESIDIDEFYYDIKFISKTMVLEEATESLQTDFDYPYLGKSSLILNNLEQDEINFLTNDQEDNLIAVPSILLKSNNIRIVSRKELKNDKLTIPPGNIRFIKEDDKFLNYSQILMENDGNIFIEGKTVKIGDFRKEFMKFNNINSIEEVDESILDFKNEKVRNMHGKGHGVLLGYEEKLSEPLVLGNTLNSVLNEIINITSDSLNKISAHVKIREDELNIEMGKLNTWIASVASIIGVPMAIPMNQNYNSDEIFSKLENQHKKLEDIQNNLTDILSRFSKTS
jgi:hypothetical protein